jgi:hypothetical protein
MGQRFRQNGPTIFKNWPSFVFSFYFEGTAGVTPCFTPTKFSVVPYNQFLGKFFTLPFGVALTQRYERNTKNKIDGVFKMLKLFAASCQTSGLSKDAKISCSRSA